MTTSAPFDAEVVEYFSALEAARREWAAQLPDWMIKSFAQDYRRGDRDPATLDGWDEYQRRFKSSRSARSNEDKNQVKMLVRCEKHRSARTPGGCRACRELNQVVRLEDQLPTAP